MAHAGKTFEMIGSITLTNQQQCNTFKKTNQIVTNKQCSTFKNDQSNCNQ